jgi:urocanate hydratase
MKKGELMKNEILYSVKAQRGPTLRCKGWKQECLLRMLENNMENAETPERLVIYGGIGKCAACRSPSSRPTAWRPAS